jgi:hypothetical protein
MRNLVVQLRWSWRTGTLLPTDSRLLSRPGGTRSMLSTRRSMHRSNWRRCNRHKYEHKPIGLIDCLLRNRIHDRRQPVRAGNKWRKPRKHGTEPILPFPVHTDDLHQRSCLLVRLYKLSKRCCKLYDCSSQRRCGRHHLGPQRRRRNHNGDSERGPPVCSEHLLQS